MKRAKAPLISALNVGEMVEQSTKVRSPVAVCPFKPGQDRRASGVCVALAATPKEATPPPLDHLLEEGRLFGPRLTVRRRSVRVRNRTGAGRPGES